MNRFFLFGCVCIMLLSYANEAESHWWTWKRYRLKFWLPDGMSVTKNKRKKFIAKGKDLVVKIVPWRASRTSSRSAALFGLKTYRFIRNRKVLFRKRIRVRGAWSFAIIGKGQDRRGENIFFAVVGLASIKNINNFYLRMWWQKKHHIRLRKQINFIAKRLIVY